LAPGLQLAHALARYLTGSGEFLLRESGIPTQGIHDTPKGAKHIVIWHMIFPEKRKML
jgi:hypothetical protein